MRSGLGREAERMIASVAQREGEWEEVRARERQEGEQKKEVLQDGQAREEEEERVRKQREQKVGGEEKGREEG